MLSTYWKSLSSINHIKGKEFIRKALKSKTFINKSDNTIGNLKTKGGAEMNYGDPWDGEDPDGGSDGDDDIGEE